MDHFFKVQRRQEVSDFCNGRKLKEAGFHYGIDLLIKLMLLKITPRFFM